MSSNNTTTNDAGNYSPASFGVLPILDLSIYVALSILSLYNIVLTWHYRPLLETSKVFTGFVAAGSWVWFICNASYIPYLVSCVNVDILQDYNSVQVIDFLNFVNDVTFTGSFILYQGATIYR